MKAQDMPMKTIVFVIIALIVIAVVVVWYLSTSGTIKSSTWDLLGIGKDKSMIECTSDSQCPPGFICWPCTIDGVNKDICIAIGSSCPT